MIVTKSIKTTIFININSLYHCLYDAKKKFDFTSNFTLKVDNCIPLLKGTKTILLPEINLERNFLIRIFGIFPGIVF